MDDEITFNDLNDDLIDIETWKTDYYCLNNDNFSGHIGGCFKKMFISKDDIKFKIAFDPNIRDYIEIYYFVCPFCGSITKLDNRILPNQIREYAKNQLSLSIK